MKTTRTTRSGFTLAETMIASCIFAMIVAGVMVFYVKVVAMSKAGSSQARYMNEAWTVEQRISALIQAGRAIGVESNEIRIMGADNVVSAIRYIDQDNQPQTVSDNVIQYDPNIWIGGDERILCRYVRLVDGQSRVFTNLPSSPAAVQIQFHVGDSTNEYDPVSIASGKGYQGVEVWISATPRDLQFWYR
jgi:hypothetical protein